MEAREIAAATADRAKTGAALDLPAPKPEPAIKTASATIAAARAALTEALAADLPGELKAAITGPALDLAAEDFRPAA